MNAPRPAATRAQLPAATRVPLDAAGLTQSLRGIAKVRVVAETGSTNSDLAAAARAGAPDGSVLVAERQRAGRGRLDRRWVSPFGTGLTFSVLIHPKVPSRSLSWLPMVVGAALADTLRTEVGVRAVLKWPNDVLVDEHKLAGVLVEVVPLPGRGTAAVIGVGLNACAEPDELPLGATSVSASLAGMAGMAGMAGTAATASVEAVDRTGLLITLLGGIRRGLRRWEADPGSARATYLPHCSSIGRWVRVELPDGRVVEGVATDVDDGGRLVVNGTAFSAGDVVHATAVRATEGRATA